MKYIKIEVPDNYESPDHFSIPNKDGTSTTATTWKPQYTKVLDHGFVGLVDFMGDDSAIVNAARVSYAGGTKKTSSDKGLIRYLMRHRHTTPTEMCVFKFHVKAPIFVFRQWHRHRTFCLGGNSSISFETPSRNKNGKHCAKTLQLSDLYKKWNDNPPVKREDKQKRSLRDFNRQRISDMLLRVYDEETQTFTTGSINNITYSGKKELYQITLENGKTLPCSKDHLLLTTNSWGALKDICGLQHHNNVCGFSKDAFILCNGEPAYQNYEWMEQQRNNKLSVQQISDNANCSYHTIRKWLKVHNLQFTGAEKNFKKGHTPWNNGVRGYSVSRPQWSDDKLTNIRTARSGKNSNFWKGGISTDRQQIARWTTQQSAKVHAKFNYTCTECHTNGHKVLHAHHLLPVVTHPENAYDFENLTTVCVPCHRVLHGQNGDYKQIHTKPHKGNTLTAVPSKIVKIEYIGIQDTYDISVDGPNHNFIANGMIVHNSINEASARYSIMSDEMYHPDIENLKPQSTDNKQGRSADVLTETEYQTVMQVVDECFDNSYQSYMHILGPNSNGDITSPPDAIKRRIDWCKEAAAVAVTNARKIAIETHREDPYPTEESLEAIIDQYLTQNGVHELTKEFPGIARELARMVLPVATYSEMYWSGNLHNILHFLKLRCDPHAQYEIRVYAEEMLKLLTPYVEWSVQAFKDYSLNAKQLSSFEVNLVKRLISDYIGDKMNKQQIINLVSTELKQLGASDREIKEFVTNFVT